MCQMRRNDVNLGESALRSLLLRLPELKVCRSDIEEAFELLYRCFRKGGKLLCCGNGGSAADCEHIAGELMKGFLKRRPLGGQLREALERQGPEGIRLAEKLQEALPCISLTGATALSTAFANDVEPELTFAQQVQGLGRPGDALLCISTSGNAKNCVCAALTARAAGLNTIVLTGRGGGTLAGLCDVAVRVPAEETYRVQEYHLPVYHALCAGLEAAFFER